MFSHCQVVKMNKDVYFKVRCVSKPKKTSKITVNKWYYVSEIGFNGHYLVRTDSGRNVWYNPVYFKMGGIK